MKTSKFTNGEHRSTNSLQAQSTSPSLSQVTKPSRITVHVGFQRDSYIFRLHPFSEDWIAENYPHKQRVETLLVGFDKLPPFQEISPSIWNNISQMITGFSSDEINQLGGFVVMNPVTKEILFDSLAIYA